LEVIVSWANLLKLVSLAALGWTLYYQTGALGINLSVSPSDDEISNASISRETIDINMLYDGSLIFLQHDIVNYWTS
jgi:hypothetical protein